MRYEQKNEFKSSFIMFIYFLIASSLNRNFIHIYGVSFYNISTEYLALSLFGFLFGLISFRIYLSYVFSNNVESKRNNNNERNIYLISSLILSASPSILINLI